MKKFIIFVLISFSSAVMHGQESKTLITKEFDIKEIFGVDLGYSKDSLVSKTEKPLPAKSDFNALFKDCTGRVFGNPPYACVAVVKAGVITMLSTRLSVEQGEGIAEMLSGDTYVVQLPKKKNNYAASYKNCTIFFGYKNDSFYMDIMPPTK